MIKMNFSIDTKSSTRRDKGATAIFLVVFATLLLTVITVSFTRLMINEQNRSLDNVLSQAAYDAALTGVEDAKRVIMLCDGGKQTACDAISAHDCYTTSLVTNVPSGNETLIQDSSGSTSSSDMNQAYTCVKVSTETDDVLLNITPNTSYMVALKATGTFDTIKLEWHSSKDGTAALAGCGSGPASVVLCDQTTWTRSNLPALLQAQLITPGSNIASLNDLDKKSAGNTIFLRPTSAGSTSKALTNFDRFNLSVTDGYSPNQPVEVRCTTGGISTYACSIELELGKDISLADQNMAFLRLSPIYREAGVRITLYKGSTLVKFNGTQPSVDSTGRANDIFRRVDARLDKGVSNFPYPQNAIDLSGSLCKDFTVGPSGVIGVPTCKP